MSSHIQLKCLHTIGMVTLLRFQCNRKAAQKRKCGVFSSLEHSQEHAVWICQRKRCEKCKLAMNHHVLFFSLLIQMLYYDAQGNEEDVVSFLRSALQCIESLQRNDPSNFDRVSFYRELDDHARTLSSLHAAVSRSDPSNRDVCHLLGSLHRCFCNLLQGHEARQRSANDNILLPPTSITGHPGRPRYSITREQISHCMSVGMAWQRIATSFGISRRTLHRHRQLHGILPFTFAVMTNEELDSLVTVILQSTPNAGEAYVLGSLRSRDLRIQRWRVRDSLNRVDPIGRSFRRRRAIRRRSYSVLSPNQLW